jgi:hypothetical protein
VVFTVTVVVALPLAAIMRLADATLYVGALCAPGRHGRGRLDIVPSLPGLAHFVKSTRHFRAGLLFVPSLRDWGRFRVCFRISFGGPQVRHQC